jgi:hypothetical protein
MNPADIVLGIDPAFLARPVQPTSIEFQLPKRAEREGEQIIVDDLGPSTDRYQQKVRSRFRRGQP